MADATTKATTDATTGTTTGTMVNTNPAPFATRIEAEVQELPRTSKGQWQVRSPITLDVMGGIAEYTGSLLLAASTSCAVMAAAAPRDDQRINVVWLNGSREKICTDWPLSRFYNAPGHERAGQLAGAPAVRKMLSEVDQSISHIAGSVLSALYALLEKGLIPHLNGGLTIAIQTDLAETARYEVAAATQAAVVALAPRMQGIDCSAQQSAEICRHAQQSVLGSSLGISAQAASMHGVPGSLLQLRCCPFESAGVLDLPEGVTVLGIDSGMRHPAADEKHAHTRVATLMGRVIIRHVLAATNGHAPVWDGSLAQLSVTDYVDALRDRLPTRLRGQLFLDRFGELPDAVATIDPNKIYKVRSRAEHHIYENDRVRQFAERVGRCVRTSDRGALIEAGELMFASHWSYGQRCGLGSIETDLLVGLLRTRGAAGGIYGARISGPGSGGTVVVLMKDSDQTHAAVQQAIDQYQRKTKRSVQLIPMARRGAPAFAVRRPE